MIYNHSVKNKTDLKKVLVICGTHGDETKSIKICWKMFIDKMFGENVDEHYIFLANENAVKYNDRNYQEIEPEDSNLNRAFGSKEETFEEIVDRIKKLINEINPDVVIDVHNSPSCNSTVLIDFDDHSDYFYKISKKHDLNPMLRPSQNFGTIKRYCVNMGIPSFTVEIAPMFSEGKKDFSKEMDFIKRTFEAGVELKQWMNVSFAASPELISKNVYCPYKQAIVEWERENPYAFYEKGEVVFTLTDMESRAQYVYYAPENLIVQDVCCPDVAFEGFAVIEYSPV